MQAQSKVWRNIEHFSKAKFPPCIKEIMSRCGYDTLMSLSAINEDSVHSLEEHVNKQCSVLRAITCCFMDYYNSQGVFEFVPGHRAVILGIPRKVKLMKAKPKVERKRKMRTVDELQMMLIDQLNKYPLKIGFDIGHVISERSIVDVRSKKGADGTMVITAGVSCPFCEKIVAVMYKGYWHSSNATTNASFSICSCMPTTCIMFGFTLTIKTPPSLCNAVGSFSPGLSNCSLCTMAGSSSANKTFSPRLSICSPCLHRIAMQMVLLHHFHVLGMGFHQPNRQYSQFAYLFRIVVHVIRRDPTYSRLSYSIYLVFLLTIGMNGRFFSMNCLHFGPPFHTRLENCIAQWTVVNARKKSIFYETA